jgi:hypothetical protein
MYKHYCVACKGEKKKEKELNEDKNSPLIHIIVRINNDTFALEASCTTWQLQPQRFEKYTQ